MPRDTDRTPKLLIAIDLLVLLAIVGCIAIELTGGFTSYVAGVRVSIHSVYRLAAAGALLVAMRFLLFRRLPPFALHTRPLSKLRRRLYQPDRDPIPERPPTGWRPALWAALGLAACGAVLLHTQLGHMYSVPDLGDPLFSMWRMGWLIHWLHGDPRPLFDGNIFYPEHLALTFSDSMLLPSLAAWPLLALGIHPVVTYNVLFMGGMLLSGLTLYLLVVRLTASRRAAFISAMIFAFYPFRFEHYSHFELQMAFCMPLALIAIHKFCTTFQIRWALAAAVCAVGQLYSSMYFAVFFLIYAIPVVGTLLIAARPPIRRLWPGALAGGALAIALAIPLARPYIAAQPVKGDRDVPAVTYYSATFSDYFEASGRSVMYGDIIRSHNPERALFPGLMALTLAALALLPPIGLTRLAYVAGLLVAFDASLGFHGVLYPYLYDWVGPIRGLRVPARFSLIVGMTLAILAGFSVQRLLARVKTRTAGALVFGALILAVGFDLRPTLDLQPVWTEPPSIYTSLKNMPHVVLAEFPIRKDADSSTESTPFMYFSLWHWLPLMDGYSGFMSTSYLMLMERVWTFPDADALDALKERGVTHVSVNCALYSGDCGDHMIEKVDASPRLRRIAATRWHGGVVQLYELQ